MATSRHGSGKAGGAPQDLGPGAVLDGRWRIETLLGTGGMGSVYRAEHVHVGRKAALKILHADLLHSPSERERFRREARIATRLQSPHVVEILDFGEDASGRPYLAMELLEGESLRAVLDREGRLSPERAVRLLRQILDGLAAAHAAGIVHRDLKPENLWLCGAPPDERLKVLDFGIAKWTEAKPGDAARTQAGLVVGTPEYLAPEQAVGGEVDRRADLYAVGILAFVMLTGRHPFDTSDIRSLVAAHAFEKVPSLSSATPELAAWPRLVDFVARAAEKDRARRPASAEALRELLDGAEEPVRRTRTPLPPAGAPRHTPQAVRASLLGVPAASLAPSVNLTLVRVEIARWSDRAPSLAPAARARALGDHDALLLPVVRGYGGRRLGTEEGASVFAFRSPTDAVQCAAAAQDAAWGTRAQTDQPTWLALLRIGVHQGEVRFENGVLAGTPSVTVRSVSETAAPGEVWLTRAVWLTMARSEAPSEEMGPRVIAGETEPIVLYRLVRSRGDLPYGGRHLIRLGNVRRSRFIEPVSTPIASIQVSGETEGAARATARIAAAVAGLCASGAVRASTRTARLLLRILSLGRRNPPALVARALDALDRARGGAAASAPWIALSLRRPVARPKD